MRTLRDLGLDLAAIRKVMNRELALSEVAAVHADALDVQIRILRLRRAVLTAVANRGATPEETHLMHKLAKLSEVERQQLVGDFLGADAIVRDRAGRPPPTNSRCCARRGCQQPWHRQAPVPGWSGAPLVP